jgi:SAM-dependent methyltransferase
MRIKTIEHLRAPVSGALLELDAIEVSGEAVISGRLVEPATGSWYRIEEGIADLVPHPFRNVERYASFCRIHGLEHGPAPSATATPDANAETQMKFFSEHRDRYEVEVVASPFYEIFDRVTLGRWITRTISRGMLVAEIGCGSGRQTLPLLRAGTDLIAIDLSEDMLRLARRKVLAEALAGQVDFLVASAENLPLANNTFDAAVIFGSLHHFSHPSATLSNVARIMRPGSHFYMLEPHKSPVRFIFDWMMRRWMLWKEEANEAPLFTASQFGAWLGAGGFDVQFRYATYLPPHLFYLIKGRKGERLLATTDVVFNAIPGLRRLGGVIIAEAVKHT